MYMVDVCVFFVNFIDGDDDWNVGGSGVRYSFFRLRSNVVVGCDDNYGNICYLCIMSMYCIECFVIWSVEEGNIFFFIINYGVDLVRVDVLRDVVGFVRGNFGFVNVI